MVKIGKVCAIEWNGKIFRVLQGGKRAIWDDELKGERIQFKVKVELGATSSIFSFTDSISHFEDGIEKLDTQEKIFAFYCFLNDAENYMNASDIDAFAKEFGYTKVSDVIKAFRGCKTHYETIKYRFGLSNTEIVELLTHLQEKYNL
jgi:hypothetical protein